MYTRTVTERVGEACGPIDWTHKIAADKPAIWREAERRPSKFLYNGRPIVEIVMYDGWPYWEARPAIYFWGPIGAEWTFFDSYGVRADSITKRRVIRDRRPPLMPADGQIWIETGTGIRRRYDSFTHSWAMAPRRTQPETNHA